MSKFRITDDGIATLITYLKQNSSLQELILNNNSINQDGGEAIGNFLKENKSLRVLHLANNRICDEGALSIAEALGKDGNRTLTE